MFKAEQIFKESKKIHEEAYIDETASWALVFAYQKKWAEDYPNDKYGYWNSREYKRLQNSAIKANVARLDAHKKHWKNYDFFELKQRQWQDFLLRDSKRIKHCPCGKNDNSAMVQCDECNNWIHLSCANLTEEEAREASDFMCSSCCLVEVKKFADDFICHEAGEIDDDGNEVPADE
jgi:hypothetical protein